MILPNSLHLNYKNVTIRAGIVCFKKDA